MSDDWVHAFPFAIIVLFASYVIGAFVLPYWAA